MAKEYRIYRSRSYFQLVRQIVCNIPFVLFCFSFSSFPSLIVERCSICAKWIRVWRMRIKKKKNILDIVFELSRIIILESILLKIIMRAINNKCNIIFSRLFRIYILRFVRFWVEIIISDRSQRGGKIFSKLLPSSSPLEYTHSQNISCSPIFPFGNKSFLASSVGAPSTPLLRFLSPTDKEKGN